MTSISRFATLMQREWLQHRTGWLVLMLAPSVLMALLSLLEGRGVHFNVGSNDSSLPPMHQLPAVLQTLGWTVSTTAISLFLVVLVVLAQWPGLARRDAQDRSIEFWRSLPTSHVQSVGATTLMHLLVLPALAVSAGMLGAQVAATLGVIGSNGPLGWLQQPWWTLLPLLGMALLRLWLGLLLAVLWMSPLLLLTMAASAWLRRWAVPVLGVMLVGGVLWLDPRLPAPLVQPALLRISSEALHALLPIRAFEALDPDDPADLVAALPSLAVRLLQDAGRVLVDTATPAFALALALGALGFALVVVQRQHSR